MANQLTKTNIPALAALTPESGLSHYLREIRKNVFFSNNKDAFNTFQLKRLCSK